MFITKDHVVFNGKKWVHYHLKENQILETTTTKTFADISLYYANIVDYFRVFLGLIACV